MNQQRGFTLLELMVVVAMIAIVVAIASPTWREFVANQRTGGVSREIYNTLMHVRMLAIKEGKTVTMTFMEGTEPVTGANKDAPKSFTRIDLSWDKNDDGSDETEEFFSVPEHVTCKTPKDTMAYNSRGIILATNSGMIESSNDRTARVYKVIVNNLGAVREE